VPPRACGTAAGFPRPVPQAMWGSAPVPNPCCLCPPPPLKTGHAPERGKRGIGGPVPPAGSHALPPPGLSMRVSGQDAPVMALDDACPFLLLTRLDFLRGWTTRRRGLYRL